MEMLDFVIRDAERLEKSAGVIAPLHTAKQFEDALCDLAKREARAGESIGCALSRLHADRDERFTALAKAAYRAEIAERVAASSPEALAKRAQKKEQTYELMMKRASDCVRGDETALDAFSRLAREGDAQFAELYRVYCEA